MHWSPLAEEATLLKITRGDDEWRFAVGASTEALRTCLGAAKAFQVAKQAKPTWPPGRSHP